MMFPTFEILGFLIALLFVVVTACGVITLKKNWFALGICCFSIIPVVGELYNYSLDNKLLHLAIIIMFIPQIIVTIPVKPNYGNDNVSAFDLNKKIMLSILVPNLLHGCFILGAELDVPHQFGYLHLVVALIIFYTVLKSNSDEGIHWK